MKVFFVGVHNKPGLNPLCSSTKSGKVIDQIIENIPVPCVKTNLFFIEKLPTPEEMRATAFYWFDAYGPADDDIIVLLGGTVARYFPMDTLHRVVKINHPAARKNKPAEYIQNAINLINSV